MEMINMDAIFDGILYFALGLAALMLLLDMTE